MNKIRIVICDDSKADREYYGSLCLEMAQKYNVNCDFKLYESGNDLLFDLENPKFYNAIDILFLDINMPGINGVEVARQAREIGYKRIIVFITVSKEHYEKAFDVRAFNYITKGYNAKTRFEEVFLQSVKAVEEMGQEVIILSGGGEYRQIEINNISYFEISKNIVTVYYGSKSFEFISTLGKLENQLFDRGFQRVHRAFLVALKHIKSISYEKLIMHDGTEIPVSRKYYSDLKKAMTEISRIAG